ncbi:MAG: lipocalin family protein [Bacteroidota bacterium]
MLPSTKSPLFLLLIPILMLATACNNDEDIDPNEDMNNRLEGEWEVESFTTDGVEQIGTSYSSFTIEFDKDGPIDGEVEWDLVGLSSLSEQIEFAYEVESMGMELEMREPGGVELEFEIEMDGDELEMTATFSGQQWEIEAERD